MDYHDIPLAQRWYVNKAAYIMMNDDERQLYLKHIKKLLRELDDQPPEYTPRSVCFVGMWAYGNHYFTSDDKVRLKRDDDNPEDPNAIKVLVKSGKWKHVAHVARREARWLRTIDDFEKLPLEFSSNCDTFVWYKIAQTWSA